jgi:ABC-type multidrug transport system fused ATPase/permease subunit
MKIIKKLLYLLTSHERKRMGLLLIMMLLMALLDMIGIASIMPFIAVLSNPQIIEENSILNTLFEYSGRFGVETNEQFFFFLGIIIFVLLIFSLTFRALTTYAQFRFTYLREFTIGRRLIEGYLHQPYSWFLNRHSADLGKTILSEVARAVGGIMSMVNLISNSIVVIVLVSLLIFINPKLAIITFLVLGLAYVVIYRLVRRFLNRIGQETAKTDQLRFKSVSEAFGASKEIKLGGLENIYVKRFTEPSQKFANNQAYSRSISQIPRFALEAVAFGGLILVILNLMTDSETFNSILPVIVLYAFTGYRLMPALQHIYSNFASLRFVEPTIDNLYNDLKKLQKQKFSENNYILPFNDKITLRQITYNYPNTSQSVLKNINISISANKRIGIVGKTGSGKTTLVDIILGLLNAQSGNLLVDGQIINRNNQKSWQNSIGYVPQKIFLTDDTIAANIAFGVDVKDIEYDKIVQASKIANLHEFVTNELPLQYQTSIGERGVRLSGGQSQRIGIARALYHEAKVLVFDEATSALDNQTEKAVMEALQNISKETTIIIIAHRLNTIRDCDEIFFLEKGEVKGQGSYDELIKSNDLFKKFTLMH